MANSRIQHPLKGDQINLPIEDTEPMATTPTQTKVRPWQSTTKAVLALGLSRDTLAKLRKEKTLVKGKHWRAKNPTAARLTYQWHVPRIEKLMGEVLEAT